MSRLYDRILEHGCSPLRLSYLYSGNDTPFKVQLETYAEEFVRSETVGASEEEIAQLASEKMLNWAEPEAVEVLDAHEIEGAAVVIGDEVADYFRRTASERESLDDQLGVLVPPYPSLWVEAQGVGNLVDARAWGILMTVDDSPTDHEVEALADATYLVNVMLVAEWRKGRPVAPCLSVKLGLGADGHWLRSGRTLAIAGDLPTFDFIGDEWVAEMRGHRGPRHVLSHLLSPLLLTVSFMHCRNVFRREVEPPSKLSKKHERKSGRPLTRYHVLEIAPMRRILDTEGEAQTKGLGHALHICRGHFKTFTEDAPLFGKRVGTYWWPAHVRGSIEEGVVEKDYRIRLDGEGIGQSYREAHEEVTVALAQERADDPDTSQRGLRAHNRTQNLLAQRLDASGFSPRSPRTGEPDFDLAWQDKDTVWVAEVKSTTEANEEHQLRLAIGQVIRYRQQLSEDGQDVRAMIATENAPFDETWIET